MTRLVRECRDQIDVLGPLTSAIASLSRTRLALRALDRELSQTIGHMGALKNKIDAREEEVRQIREKFAPILQWNIPALRPHEQDVLSMLYATPDGASAERIEAIGIRRSVQSRGVLMWCLRKKIRPLGIEIITVRGFGWRIGADGRARLKEFLL